MEKQKRASLPRMILALLVRIVCTVLIVGVVVLAGLIAYLSITEYKPADREAVAPADPYAVAALPSLGTEYAIVTWNTGYGALGKDSDFAMDGGGNAPPATKEQVEGYLKGIAALIGEEDPAILMLQEVDLDSARSYRIDHRDRYSFANDAVALNYSCDYVPYPWPPLGKVESGVFTASDYLMASGERVALPCPFSWPLRIANLKRCLLVTRFPVEGSDRELVIVNMHLEAYDSGEGKIAQTKKLLEYVQAEYEKGNWVIVGGDWNQAFPGSLDVYPNTHPENWAVGQLEESVLPEGWRFAYDTDVPTCRLLNQPYDPTDTVNTQYYVIDGFMVSPNVEVKTVRTLDEAFENTDHNPVEMTVELK